jgi:hypothetical protein
VSLPQGLPFALRRLLPALNLGTDQQRHFRRHRAQVRLALATQPLQNIRRQSKTNLLHRGHVRSVGIDGYHIIIFAPLTSPMATTN